MAENTKQIDLNVIQKKLYEKLKTSGWGSKMKTFLLSNDFLDILKFLHSESKSGNRFTPVIKQLFRAFEECPYEELKVVMIGQDPYPQGPPKNSTNPLPVADGISFSCMNHMKAEASLRYILKEVDRTVYQSATGLEHDHMNPDLTRWANQGILMLNTALTTRIGKIGSHYEIWKPFNNMLFDILKNYNCGLIVVFLGKKAEEWEDKIGDAHHKIFVSHPASAAYSKQKIWETNDVFNRISKLVKEHYDYELKW